MTTTPETIGVTITYKTPITFHLEIVGIAKENELRQRFLGLTDEEKDKKEYQLNVDLLAELSVQLPTGMFPADAIPKCPASEAIKTFYAEKTVLKERTVEYAVRAYFSSLTPSVSFQ